MVGYMYVRMGGLRWVYVCNMWMGGLQKLTFLGRFDVYKGGV
jgi:hypothetical protein